MVMNEHTLKTEKRITDWTVKMPVHRKENREGIWGNVGTL